MFSFRDLFKYSYLKQTRIDSEDILDENNWAEYHKRKGTFDIIFNIFDSSLEGLRANQRVKEEELKILGVQLEAIRTFVSNLSFSSLEEYQALEKQHNMAFDYYLQN